MRALTALCWSTLWYIVGLGLFSSGFFLSRLELPHVSACDARPAPLSPFTHPPYVAAVEGEAEVCWGAPRRYDRMVLVVIDALRFDFVFSRDDKPSPFHRHIPIIGQTMRRAPERALLYQFEATPPTVTAQRLKGLSTGGLPTFMDMSKNFASPAVHADNIVAQLARAGRRVVFMGDDTWEKLFPPALHFARSSPFPSFNVKDLHTVDDGCTRLLTGRHPRAGSTVSVGGGGGGSGTAEAASAAASAEAEVAPPPIPELERDDWDVVIAHFLGVDHVGHRFGPNNPAMKTKLEEMNTVLSDVLEMLDERDEKTLLVVIGDHGMTADGNHGGASKLERRSALFMYSGGKGALPFRGQGAAAESAAEATKIAPATPRVIPQVRCSFLCCFLFFCLLLFISFVCSLFFLFTNLFFLNRIIPQVDLLPSLALILGVPIPFGSLGSIVPELFATDRGELHRALSINAAQVWSYLSTYVAVSPTFPAAAMRRLRAEYEEALRAGAAIEQSAAEGRSGAWLDAARARAAGMLQDFLRSALRMCRERWATFNLHAMLLGGTIVALAVVVTAAELVALVAGVGSVGGGGARWSDTRLLGAGAVGALLGAASVATSLRSARELVNPCVAGFALGSAGAAAANALQRCAAAVRGAIDGGAQLKGGADAAAFAAAALGAVICRALGLLSNSYIEVSFLFIYRYIYANHAHNLTRSPKHI